MADYSFFALLFLLASALAPDAVAERTWTNSRHPEQSIRWTREGDGWAMRVNGRELGVFHRDGDSVVHHTGQGAPHRFPVEALAPAFARAARRIPLGARFAPVVLAVEREADRVTLSDPSRELLRVPLHLSAR
ncbi:MAG: hypothetical protein KF729_38255 [Sandaracinaceae bacterium]|nr:hypothetical protein [Sandaracinaceae bacterium]